MLYRFLFACCLAALAGCASTVQQSSSSDFRGLSGKVLATSFDNATDDENASKTALDLCVTALMQRGLPVDVRAPQADPLHNTPPLTSEQVAEEAKNRGSLWIVTGTVHEYRYKTDLDGDPAVGITLRIIQSSSGRIVWQGSGNRSGSGFAPLSGVAQKLIADIVSKIPGPGR